MYQIKCLMIVTAMTMVISACSLNDVSAENARKVSEMSVELKAAAKSAKSPQSTIVTRESTGHFRMTPISNARQGFFDNIVNAANTKTYVDCETYGMHTSTACETNACVTKAINDCSGTVEWCAQ